MLIRPILKKIPYEFFKGRRPILSHLKVFGCKCFILNNGKESVGKFDAKADEGVFLGYAIQSHAYRVYNKRLMAVKESMHVVFDETNPKLQDHVSKVADEEDIVQEKDNIISDIEQGVSTRRKLAFVQHNAFVSQIEPKNVNDVLCDSNWVVAMQDELN